jgi:hypothetical protein
MDKVISKDHGDSGKEHADLGADKLVLRLQATYALAIDLDWDLEHRM